MKYLKIILAAALTLTLGACASKAPPPPVDSIQIPVQLLNVEKNTVVMPVSPTTVYINRIRESDPADQALETTLEYTEQLQQYSNEVTDIAEKSLAELDDRNKRIEQIKQYILLKQANGQ